MERHRAVVPAAVLGLLLALGMYAGGVQLTEAVRVWKQSDRTVTVKGLAERDVPVDLVLWPISFSVRAETLDGLYEALRTTEDKVRNFLYSHGFSEAEISVTQPVVTDRWEHVYGDSRPAEQYSADGVVLLRTGNVEQAKAIMPRADELVKEGVLLSRNWEHRPQFIFTGLNDIKPEMIAEATFEARKAAEQFARDSGSEVGKIRSAQQGYFSIEDLDSYTPDVKRVRVVTTVEYYLLD